MKTLIISILLLCNYNSHSQTSNTQSQTQLIAKEKNDTASIIALVDLSMDYMNSKPDTALVMAQKALKMSREVKYIKGEIHSLNSLGNIFETSGNYPKALENFLHALKLTEEINDQRRIAIINSNIGLLYAYQDDYKLSLSYYFKSKQIAELIHSDEVFMRALSNLGDSYEKLNQLDSALIYTQQAYEIALHLKDIDARGISLNNLGNIHSKMGHLIKAKAYYRLSISDFIHENDLEGICEDAIGMAKIFRKTEQRDSTLYYARLSLSAAQQGGFTKSLLSASSFLSDYFENIQRIDSAYVYQKITVAAKDSLFNQEKTKELQNLVFAEKIRQQEIEAAKEQKIQERKKNIQMAGIGTFIPVFFGIIILFRKRKTKPKTINLMGILGLMFLFEFISLIIGPYIDTFSQHSTILLFIIQIIVGIILVPIHHKVESWVKDKLAHRIVSVAGE